MDDGECWTFLPSQDHRVLRMAILLADAFCQFLHVKIGGGGVYKFWKVLEIRKTPFLA